MKIPEEILKTASEKGTYQPKLSLFVQKEGGGTQSTGPHEVKLISSKLVKGSDFATKKERAEIQLLLEENGVEKTYQFPAQDKEGGVHYLVERFAPIPEGSVVVLEGKKAKSGVGSYISVQLLEDGELREPEGISTSTNGEIPVIEDEEIEL